MSTYSLRKSTQILRNQYHFYRKKKKELTPSAQNQFEAALLYLKQAIDTKEKKEASDRAKGIEALSALHFVKHPVRRFLELTIALAFALAIAILIRQVWFEFYEIPTGSMRPTFKEHDRVAVSKTTFGINLPLTTKHIEFDPSLVERGGTVIFSGDGMDISNLDMRYFYLFPGKRQFVKRLLGKPGDTLYFYGGKLYGIDKEGNDITPLLNPIAAIDHVPIIQFEGKLSIPSTPKNGLFSPIFSSQMNEPVAKLTATSTTQLSGQMLPFADGRPPAPDYYSLWGIDDYAQVRLATKEEAELLGAPSSLLQGELYLELQHHPSVKSPTLVRDERGRVRPALTLSTSWLPLAETHLRSLMENLYTVRFWVKDGFASRYAAESSPNSISPYRPELSGVPDGCYEFYYGKAYKIGWQGTSFLLPNDHPLYTFSKERIQTLFNLGIEFDTRFSPTQYNSFLLPSRFGYFQEGHLCLLGAPILSPSDPLLIDFLARESASPTPYHDPTAPDSAKIRALGLSVPEGHYFVLGDNYANSGDSREFGFVPQGNLRGTPSLIFWPPGPRFGLPNQPPYAHFPPSRLIIWALFLFLFILWRLYHKKRNNLRFPIP